MLRLRVGGSNRGTIAQKGTLVHCGGAFVVLCWDYPLFIVDGGEREDGETDMEQPTYHYARENPPCPVPSLDGYVIVESSDVPVPYHITSCGAGSINAAQGHSLAVSSARIACMSADIMRGQLHAGKLRRAVTGPCLKKLETMAYLLDNHMQSNPELKAKLRYLPVVPRMMSGMFINPTTFEISTHLTIGVQNYWSNIVLRQMGCRWLCTMTDIG